MFFVIFAVPRKSPLENLYFWIIKLLKMLSNIIRVQIQQQGTSDFGTVDIPITPYTTCAEIVNCLRGREEEDEQIYYLTHLWKNSETITSPKGRPYVIVRESGGNFEENIFRLRNCYYKSPIVTLLQKIRGENLERPTKVQSPNRSLSPEGTHRQSQRSNMAITENEKPAKSQAQPKPFGTASSDSSGLTVEELRQISSRQQSHIECQRRRLSEKTSRLRQLRQKDAIKRKSGEAEDVSISKLRSSVEEHDFTIKQAVATRMQLNETKFSNENMSLELNSLKTSFAEKQRELSRYTQRVEELKIALDQLRSTTMKHSRKSDSADQSMKSPNKLPSTNLIQAVNLELKAKLGGLPETDDAKAMSQKLEDKRRESRRLDEQLAMLRTRLGLKEVKMPPPVPIRSLSPQRPLRTSPLSSSLEHQKHSENASTSASDSGSLMDRNKGRYAPRAVIADTYMRRLRTGRVSTGNFVSSAKFHHLKKPIPIEQPLDCSQVSSSSGDVSSQSEKEVKADDRNDSNNNDSGHGPSIGSSVPSASGTDTLEDDVFTGRTAVPPPAAFEGDLSSSSTSQPFSDSASSSNNEPSPQLSGVPSSKPRKSCLKASCDIVQFAATRPTQLSLEASQVAVCITDPVTPSGLKQSVSFDPLALLLDAAMEGEISLVKQTAQQVKDVSAGNDEGTTALHNSVCSGHDEVSHFLVTEASADVNAVDIDGWTPLHCAASCASLTICRLLVEYGAAVFLCTNGDDETALEKCDEDADGGQRTAEYLFNVQEQLGVTNNGVVYAVFPYKAKNKDELSFIVNEAITVLKRGDAAEIEWYWARNEEGVVGYIPRNFIALHPRQLPQKRPEGSLKEDKEEEEEAASTSEKELTTESSLTSGGERSDKTAL